MGLAEGSTGDAVKAVQQRLIDLGVYVAGGADGVFGPATSRAVRQFQTWNGIAVSGSIDAATATALGVDTPAAGSSSGSGSSGTNSSNSSSNSPYVGLAQGSRGDRVVELQRALMATGRTLRGGADGVFGSVTTSVLKSFEQANGLTQDGVVGDREVELLGLGASSGSGSSSTNTNSTPSGFLGLHVGSRGTSVRTVQQALITAGVSIRGGADGVFGPVTKAALVSYQSALGITADGTVNADTIAKLALEGGGTPTPLPSSGSSSGTSTPTTGSSTSSGSSYVGLAVGARGTKVADLQRALQNTGVVVRGGADGVFGSATATALKTFQQVNGKEQTGVVSEWDASTLGLGGSTTPSGATNPSGNGWTQMVRFPMQGVCSYIDTWQAARGNGRRHEGTDMIGPEGKLLYAVVDGEISKLYWDQPGALSGNGLRVQASDGTYFTYLHMSSFAPGIGVGTKVKAGDVIGFVGSTGSAGTAHLHFEIHPFGGAAINPYPYVKAIDGCSNSTPQYQVSYPVPG